MWAIAFGIVVSKAIFMILELIGTGIFFFIYLLGSSGPPASFM
jgi:hypothetical protein